MNERDELNTKTNLKKRASALSQRIVDMVSEQLGPDAVCRHQQFEEDVRRRIENGARFVPRKRKSS